MRVTYSSRLRSRILALIATGGLATTACGGDTEGGSGTGGTSSGGASSGGVGAGGATGGSAGVSGGTGGGPGGMGGTAGSAASGGVAGHAGSAGAGGAAGSAGAGGGLTIIGTLDCNSCGGWESCWPKGSVPVAGGASPSVCPQPHEVDTTHYPHCQGGVWFSGLSEKEGKCCYVTQTCAVGRPFLVAGALRVASPVRRSDWCAPHQGATPDLSDEALAELGAAWLVDAQLEHASVAAFARLTLELMALGAPPELVRASQVASLEEIEHARACFALASRFGGRPVGPGPLDLDGALTVSSVATLVETTFDEGCIGETVAALIAERALSTAEDPEVRQVLEQITKDEAEHAELAWRIVAWALGKFGEPVRVVVERALARALERESATPRPNEREHRASFHAFGRLTGSELAAVRREALAAVVEPCVRALLDAEPSAASSLVTGSPALS